ncbi:MAG: HEAT repeat domain-containing protein [Chloroflexota bacterium]
MPDQDHEWQSESPLAVVARMIRETADRLAAAGITSLNAMRDTALDRTASTELRIDAIRGLGWIDAPEVFSIARAALASEPDRRLRAAAACTIEKQRSHPATDTLLATLDTEIETQNRQEAIWMLAESVLRSREVVTGEVIPRLRRIVRDPSEHEETRGAAIEQLGRLRDRRIVPTLITCLRDPAPTVRFFASYALGGIGDQTAISELERVVHEDNGVARRWGPVRDEAIGALSAIRARLARRRRGRPDDGML